MQIHSCPGYKQVGLWGMSYRGSTHRNQEGIPTGLHFGITTKEKHN
jgi:hypothetical protein